MTIEKLSEKKVLISLCDEDMLEFSLDIETMGLMCEKSRSSILRLLKLAIKETGMNAKSKTVLMEALPLRSGCLFLLTFTEKSKENTYKLKKSGECICFAFADAEKMLCAAESLYLKSIKTYCEGLWLYKGKYYLIFGFPIIKNKVRTILEFYGKGAKRSALAVSRIKEGGKLLCTQNTLYDVGRRLSTKSFHEIYDIDR